MINSLCVIAFFRTNITPITISGVYFGHDHGLISFQSSLYIYLQKMSLLITVIFGIRIAHGKDHGGEDQGGPEI